MPNQQELDNSLVQNGFKDANENSIDRYYEIQNNQENISEESTYTNKEIHQTTREIAAYNKKVCMCPEILVVDDDGFNISVLKRILESYFFIVQQAADGQQAVDTVQNLYKFSKCCRSFKFIIMDIDMPVKDGFQASQEILDFYKSKRIRSCQIAAHSAAWDKKRQDIAKNIGIQLAFPKPLKIDKLNQVLLNLFPYHLMQGNRIMF